jgi:hypothetical protein
MAMERRNDQFELGGLNHVALVCSDMERTVEFAAWTRTFTEAQVRPARALARH